MPGKLRIDGLIKELRERLDVTQAQLASLLKVSLPTIGRWESGRTQPDTLALHAIQEFLRKRGARCADLLARYFGGTGAPEPVAGRRGPRRRQTEQAVLDLPSAERPAPGGALDTRSMEGMLWKAACGIRGEKDAPKFKDYILPLVFIKRLSDVFDDEIARLTETYGDEEIARTVLEADHSLVRFYIPPEATWAVVSGRKSFAWPEGKRPRTQGERLTQTVRAITRANPSLQGVIDIVDYNETRNGEREISDDALSRLIETLSDPRYRLGLRDVEPDFLGRAYEYLLRKFAEGQGQSAGEFFTPKEVGWLIARLVQARQGEAVYDPCCGSGGLLIKCQLALEEREPSIARPLRLYGQELTGASFAIARMNMVLHDMEGEIVRGNTMTNPKFLDGSSLRPFEVVVTNPMWNQDNFDPTGYESDPFERFAERGGFAPAGSADWAWLQHVLASLNDRGRGVVVLDTGAASRGSGSQGENREKTIRRWFVDHDVVEGVILLPDNLFYNTTAAGIIVVLNRTKPADRRGRVVLVNASAEFQKGRPKNFIPDASIGKIADAFHAGRDVERFVKVVSLEEIAKQDYNLSPSRYIETAAPAERRDVQTLLDELARLDAEARRLDGELKEIFTGLGYRWGGGSVLPEFMLFFVQGRYEHLRQVSQSGGSTRGALTCDFLKGYPVPGPRPQEQCQIAGTLGSILTRLRIEETRCGALRALFSSMLHLLMTGQVRVNPETQVGGEVATIQSRGSQVDGGSVGSEKLPEGVERFVAEVVRRFEPERVVLFGQHVEGSPKALSEVGLLVEMDFEGLARNQAARIAHDIPHDFTLDLIVRRPRDIERAVGIGDAFIKGVLDRGRTLHRRPGEAPARGERAPREERPARQERVSEEKLREIVQRIVETVQPDQIILFGSAARGEMGPDSDLDFLVVKSCEDRRQVAAEIYRNLRGIGVPMDVIVVTPEAVERDRDTVGLIIRPALREGRVVYAA